MLKLAARKEDENQLTGITMLQVNPAPQSSENIHLNIHIPLMYCIIYIYYLILQRTYYD